MKTKILLICFVLLTGMASAQSYFILKKTGTNGESAGNYVFTTLGKMVIQGTTTGLGDTLTAWQKLPFDWNFYGKTVKGYYVSDNGYISFDSNSKGSNPNNVSIPDTNAPKSAIFGFWDALAMVDPDGQSSYTNLIHIWTYGTAPNRVHVIHWFRAFHEPYNSDQASQFCFGIRLYESGPKAFDIVYDYRYMPSTIITPTDATVGCQNIEGSDATMVAGSPSFAFPDITADKSDDVVYEFYYGVQPTLDLSVVKLNITDIAKTSSSIPVQGTIRNMGSDVISYFTLNYRVDGGATISQVVNGANIASGNTYDFTHSDIWTTSPTEMNSLIEVWATLLNGNADQNNSNDTMKATVQVVPISATRLPLHEVFTSSTCGPCNAGNANLLNIFDNNPDKYSCVKYQMDYPGTGDPYYTSECGSRSTYYGYINSIPRLQVDGGWNNNPGGYTQSLFDQYSNVPSYININATYTVLPYASDPTDTTVKIDVTVSPLANFIGYNPKLYMAIIETTTSRNVKTNGETEFHYVMKKMVPGPTGIGLGKMVRGTDQKFSKSYTFRGKYRLQPDAHTNPISLLSENSVENYNNLAVVVWVQDDNTLQVLQSAWGRLPVSINDNKPNSIISEFYPNPVIDQATVKFRLEKQDKVSFEVINMLGQSSNVLDQQNFQPGDHQVTLPLSGLEPGAYILLIKTSNGVSSVRFIK